MDLTKKSIESRVPAFLECDQCISIPPAYIHFEFLTNALQFNSPYVHSYFLLETEEILATENFRLGIFLNSERKYFTRFLITSHLLRFYLFLKNTILLIVEVNH